MKITVISIGDPKDKRTWSGTTSHMYEALNNSNVDVDTITLKNWFTKFYTRYVKFTYKFFHKQKIADNNKLNLYGKNARVRQEREFSLQTFITNFEAMYTKLIIS